MRQHLNAFTASFTMHLLAAATLLWFSAAAVRQASRRTAATRAAAAPVFEYLELPPVSTGVPKPRASAELSIPNETGSAEIRMPNFEFDFSKIARADAQTVDAAQIKQILDAERRRWTDFWWARLRRFGHTFGTF